MPDESENPTQTSLYLGMDPREAVCERHGEMIEQGLSVVGRTGHVYATRGGVSLFACPECCIDLLVTVGEPNADVDRAIAFVWNRQLERDWDALEALFTDLGAGRLETREGAVVLADDEGDRVDVSGRATLTEAIEGEHERRRER